MVKPRPSAPEPVLRRLRAICAPLPEAREEAAWVGVRWRVGTHTFAHVLMLEDGRPPAYAAACGRRGPAGLLTFRSGDRLFQPERFDSPPFFRPPWFANIIGLVLEADTDWDDVAGLVRESYRTLAPARLAQRLDEGR